MTTHDEPRTLVFIYDREETTQTDRLNTRMSHGTALLSDEGRAAVVDTVMVNNPDMAPHLAGRIVDEAVKYLAAVATVPEPLTPSRVVGEGWHALILHTRVYKRLCDKIGKFVHHMPERPDPESRDPEATGGSAALTPVTGGGNVDTVSESQSERARGRR